MTRDSRWFWGLVLAGWGFAGPAGAQTARALNDEPVSITVVSATNVAEVRAGSSAAPIKDTDISWVEDTAEIDDDGRTTRTITLMY
jgi:hypothetical protein